MFVGTHGLMMTHDLNFFLPGRERNREGGAVFFLLLPLGSNNVRGMDVGGGLGSLMGNS